MIRPKLRTAWHPPYSRCRSSTWRASNTVEASKSVRKTARCAQCDAMRHVLRNTKKSANVRMCHHTQNLKIQNNNTNEFSREMIVTNTPGFCLDIPTVSSNRFAPWQKRMQLESWHWFSPCHLLPKFCPTSNGLHLRHLSIILLHALSNVSHCFSLCSLVFQTVHLLRRPLNSFRCCL